MHLRALASKNLCGSTNRKRRRRRRRRRRIFFDGRVN